MVRHHQRVFLRAAVIIGLISPALAQAAPSAEQASEPPLVDIMPAAPGSPPADVAPAAPVLITLYKFPGGAKGYSPRGGVVMDAAGNIYGTTQYDGQCSTCGIIYKLAPPAKGKTVWTFSVLHKFILGNGGIHPTGPLTLFKGVIYGTTSAGGDPRCGCGTVFKITPAGAFTPLHTFTPSSKGSTPIGGLLIDTDGTMYGTTNSGGKHGSGILYKISTSGGGFAILHDFAGDLNGGPQGELMFGKDGAIYGTQYGGGKYNQGVVFRMTKAGGYAVLYDFLGVNQPGGSHDGAQPEGRLALGTDGTIYGTTTFGGSPSGYGTAWSIKQNGAKWTYKQLHIFGMGSDGNLPHSGLVKGVGNIYYGTGAGGGHFQEGVIYKLAPPVAPSTKWTSTVLHSFTGRDKNGNSPYGVLLYAKSKLYGTDLLGGHVVSSGECNDGCGTVFEFTP
jgi:uncharacterized repeat protein (TIGR03803 family)